MGLKCVHTARCPGTCWCLFSHVCRPTSRAVIFKVWSLNRYHRRHWELVRNAQSQAPRQNQTLCGRSPASCMLTSPWRIRELGCENHCCGGRQAGWAVCLPVMVILPRCILTPVCCLSVGVCRPRCLGVFPSSSPLSGEPAHGGGPATTAASEQGGFEELAQEAEGRPSLETDQPCELLPLPMTFSPSC